MAAFRVAVSVNCLQNSGNVTDASILAVCVALSETELPKTSFGLDNKVIFLEGALVGIEPCPP